MSTKEYGTNKKLEIENIFLGLGSNQGDRELNLKNSIKLLNSRVGKVLNASGIYESEPWGVKNQNYFLNQVIEIETHIDPNDLLNICKNIEYDMGRKPEIRWGKRIIDIDIIFYENLSIKQGQQDNVTNNKYKKKVDDVKNEKLKKSLIELTKVFREK